MTIVPVKLELFKLHRSRYFLASLVVVLVIFTFGYSRIYAQSRLWRHQLILPQNWSTILRQGTEVLDFYVPIVVILLVGAELKWRTIRQDYVDGMSLTSIEVGKLFLVLYVAFLSGIAVIAPSTMFALSATRTSGTSDVLIRAQDLFLLGGTGLSVFAGGLVALFFLALTRSGGAALASTVVYAGIVEPLLRLLLTNVGGTFYSNLLPLSVFSALKDPWRYDPTVGRGVLGPSVQLLLALASVYIGALVGLTYWGLKRRQL